MHVRSCLYLTSNYLISAVKSRCRLSIFYDVATETISQLRASSEVLLGSCFGTTELRFQLELNYVFQLPLYKSYLHVSFYIIYAIRNMVIPQM